MTGEASTTSGAETHWGGPALALLGIWCSSAVVAPPVLVAVPFLLLVLGRDRRGTLVVALAALAAVAVALGPRDGLWYAGRAWAVMLGGFFVALGIVAPRWRLTARALASVGAAVVSAAAFFTLRAGSWSALDWAVTDSITVGVATWVDLAAPTVEDASLRASFVDGMYALAETWVAVYPAMLAIASIAALGVASWVAAKAAGVRADVLGPVSGFRFNDHLVWIMIGGLMLVMTRLGDAAVRVGANAVVLMSALYAVRGTGVVMGVTGGLSIGGYALLVLFFAMFPPVVVGMAIVIGIGDTWLDLRALAADSST